MNAIEQLAQQMGFSIHNYEPTVAEMVDLPPTGQVTNELDHWRSILYGRTTPGPETARAEARVRFWEARERVARRRDELLMERHKQHPECFCLGRGGRNSVTLSYRGADGSVLAATLDGMPVEAFEVYCPCPDGQDARARALEVRMELEAASRQRKTDRIVGLAGIPPIYDGMAGDTWRRKMEERGATTKQIASVLVPINIWLKHNHERKVKPAEAPSVLLLAGPYGTGKSALAASLGRFWLDHGRTVIYRSGAEWFSQLRSSPWRHNDQGEPTERDLIVAGREADLFIMDDWGSEDWGVSGDARMVAQTLLLLEHRMTHGMPTILTTNLEPEEVAERVGHRLLDRVTSDLISIRVNFNDLPNLRQQTW